MKKEFEEREEEKVKEEEEAAEAHKELMPSAPKTGTKQRKQSFWWLKRSLQRPKR